MALTEQQMAALTPKQQEAYDSRAGLMAHEEVVLWEWLADAWFVIAQVTRQLVEQESYVDDTLTVLYGAFPSGLGSMTMPEAVSTVIHERDAAREGMVALERTISEECRRAEQAEAERDAARAELAEARADTRRLDHIINCGAITLPTKDGTRSLSGCSGVYTRSVIDAAMEADHDE